MSLPLTPSSPAAPLVLLPGTTLERETEGFGASPMCRFQPQLPGPKRLHAPQQQKFTPPAVFLDVLVCWDFFFNEQVKLPTLGVQTNPGLYKSSLSRDLVCSLQVSDTMQQPKGSLAGSLPAHIPPSKPCPEGGGCTGQQPQHNGQPLLQHMGKIYSRFIGASNDLATVTITLVPNT